MINRRGRYARAVRCEKFNSASATEKRRERVFNCALNVEGFEFYVEGAEVGDSKECEHGYTRRRRKCSENNAQVHALHVIDTLRTIQFE